MGATGLSADPKEYRARLTEQDDRQLDAWAMELLRDVAKRRGVVGVVDAFRRVARLTDAEFERVFTSGGGAPATMGRDASGRVVVPATSLHALVSGLRRRTADPRDRLIDYLVDNFHEVVYV